MYPIQPNSISTTLAYNAEPIYLPLADLWDLIERETLNQLSGLKFLSAKDVRHRFSEIWCPKETALVVDGQYLHANKVGEGITQRLFIASQAPLVEDLALFWKAVFESHATIFDLTTFKDQKDGGITKYYPTELNQSVEYGSFSVKLTGIRGNIHTYLVENKVTGEERSIRRYHYAEWPDFSAISLSALDFFIDEFETLVPNPNDLAWIHCRAGVGRTGTLIAALILKEKVLSREIRKENLDASLVNLILKLRSQRSPVLTKQMVQLDLLRQYALSLMDRIY